MKKPAKKMKLPAAKEGGGAKKFPTPKSEGGKLDKMVKKEESGFEKFKGKKKK